jgi:hypothetical protein
MYAEELATDTPCRESLLENAEPMSCPDVVPSGARMNGGAMSTSQGDDHRGWRRFWAGVMSSRDPSAANLKFLQQLPQAHSGTSNSKPH